MFPYEVLKSKQTLFILEVHRTLNSWVNKYPNHLLVKDRHMNSLNLEDKMDLIKTLENYVEN